MERCDDGRQKARTNTLNSERPVFSNRRLFNPTSSTYEHTTKARDISDHWQEGRHGLLPPEDLLPLTSPATPHMSSARKIDESNIICHASRRNHSVVHRTIPFLKQDHQHHEDLKVEEDLRYPLQLNNQPRIQSMTQTTETNTPRSSNSPFTDSPCRRRGCPSETKLSKIEKPMKSPRVVISFDYEIGEAKKKQLARAVESVLSQENFEDDSKPIKLQDPPKDRYKRQFSAPSNTDYSEEAFRKKIPKDYGRQTSVAQSKDDYDVIDGVYDKIMSNNEPNDTQNNMASKRTTKGKSPCTMKDGTIVPSFTRAKRPSIVIDASCDEVDGDVLQIKDDSVNKCLRRRSSNSSDEFEKTFEDDVNREGDRLIRGDARYGEQNVRSLCNDDSEYSCGLRTTACDVAGVQTSSYSYARSPSSLYSDKHSPDRRTLRSRSDLEYSGKHDSPHCKIIEAGRRNQRSASQPVNTCLEEAYDSYHTNKINTNRLRRIVHSSAGTENSELCYQQDHGRRYPEETHDAKRQLFSTSDTRDELTDRCISPIPHDIKEYLASKNILSSNDIRNLEHGIPLRSKPSYQSYSQVAPSSSSHDSQYQVVLLPRDQSTPTTRSRYTERGLASRSHGGSDFSIGTQHDGFNEDQDTTSPRRWNSFSPLSTSADCSTFTFDGKRKRKRGDIDMRIQCSDDMQLSHDGFYNPTTSPSSRDRHCNCDEVERYILRMARESYTKIRRTDDSVEAFQQFEDELHETNKNIIDAIKFRKAMAAVCAHGRKIENIYNGSVVFALNCPTLISLEELWDSYVSGKLQKLLQDGFITHEIQMKFGNSICLSVIIDRNDYMACRHEMETTEGRQTLPRSKKASKNIATHKENQSVFFPESFVHPNRSQSAPELESAPEKSSSSIPSPGYLMARSFAFSLSLSGSPHYPYEHGYTEEPPQSPRKKFFADVGNMPQERTPHTPKSPLSPIN